MSPVVIGLVLFAAALHATWNAVLRGGADRLWSITIMSCAAGVVAAPAILFLPPPLPASWPYLVVSSALQVGYSAFLVHAYRHGDLGSVYPIVRGSVPLLVTVGSLLLTPQRPGALALTGVTLVGSGIISLAFGKAAASGRSVALAFVTSLFIAAYVTADAVGVRASGNPRSYAAWICLAFGTLMFAMFVALRGRLRLEPRSPETLKAVAGGVLSMLAYAAMVFALALGPLGPVSALRETSVVFALVIGRVFLGEPFTVRRLLACAAVALGAFLVGYAR